VRKSRRQIANRIIEATGVALVVLDAVVFFAVYRPLGLMMGQAAGRHALMRQTIRKQQVRVDLLKRYEAELPAAGKGLQDFTTDRVPSRREAYSTAAHLIHKVAEASGVTISQMGYRLDTEHHDPLQRLGIEINLAGSYPSLLKFSHALETSNDFIVVREFYFTPGGEDGGLGLRLGADLYLTP